MSTFLQLQDRALDFNYGTADRTRVKSFINMAYRDLASRHRWTWLEESAAVTTTAGSATTALSSVTDLMEFGRIRVNATNTWIDPEYVDWNEWLDDYMRDAAILLPSGPPTKFSIWENVIYWDTIPDQTYSYTLFYWKRPPELVIDATEPLVPTADRDVLVFGALYYAALRDNDMGRAQQYQALYEGMAAKMRRLDKMRTKQSPQKIPMPRSYGSTYS
jgi:hypothetical protein